MAAGTWKLFYKGKQNLGKMVINLTGPVKMTLHRTSASTFLLGACISTYASIPAEISATGGYATGGRSLTGLVWTVSGSSYKFSYTTAGLIFTASNAALNNIRFAVLRYSTRPICYVPLSTGQFTVASGNTLTIKPATGGVFTLT